MRYGTWETTVYGSTFEEIQRNAEAQAKAFGLVDPVLMCDVRAHKMSKTLDGKQHVVEYEATVAAKIED